MQSVLIGGVVYMEIICDILFVLGVGGLFRSLSAFVVLCVLGIFKAVTHKGPENLGKIILLDIVFIVVCFILASIFDDIVTFDGNDTETVTEITTMENFTEVTTAAIRTETTTVETTAEATTAEEIAETYNTEQQSPAQNIDYLNIYRVVLESMKASYGEYTRYAIYDIDGNGVKELFVMCGYSEADTYLNVYTIKNGTSVLIGSYFAGHSSLYVAEDGNGVYLVYAHMDYQEIARLTTDGNVLFDEVISKEDYVEEYYDRSPEIPCYYVGDYDALS